VVLDGMSLIIIHLLWIRLSGLIRPYTSEFRHLVGINIKILAVDLYFDLSTESEVSGQTEMKSQLKARSSG
jgi:hypothetical protein